MWTCYHAMLCARVKVTCAGCPRVQVKRKKAAILALKEADKAKAKKEGTQSLLPLLDEEPGLKTQLVISKTCLSKNVSAVLWQLESNARYVAGVI